MALTRDQAQIMWPFQNYATERHLPHYSICSHSMLVHRQLPCGKLLSYVKHGHVERSCCYGSHCIVYLANQRSTLASINSLPDFNPHSFYVRKTVPIANLI